MTPTSTVATVPTICAASLNGWRRTTSMPTTQTWLKYLGPPCVSSSEL